ncbi:NEW3 domain-containing protein [Cognatilysobacter bugurensis]|uniref:Alpha-galactosidase NEW3 domain-containing protein n=1 Tax=Cognatilysobacter bugurensis TaxID=543356 RepID=A0A918SXQ7_9GAMM|nr:NEW3 domain-containing protein [Lysobacter bugurensis]GHA74704.1 hypothetical protein GCM10007067_09680 [Lysobacter bugurensis]
MSPLHRNTLLAALLIPMGLAASATASAATFYVRADGGDANQCNGRSDAAYPGTGTALNCAWKHPFFALPPGGTPRIAGGDTLIIGGGSYMMGQGAPGAGSCGGSSCYMAAPPSGPSATTKTRILGKAGTTPVLWGAVNTSRIINLQDRSNIEIGNLEVTDRNDCVYSHTATEANCVLGTNYARVGLYATNSSNVWLHDLNIHGLAHMGMNTGALSNWLIERVRINKNGKAGWDGSVGGTASSNSGSMVLRNVEVAWNGCGERWQTGATWACWAQQTGGYGDGIGTYYTGGQWLIEDSFIHHNTSDGLDLRYMDGEDTTTVVVRRLHAVGNAGNQAKIRGNVVVENSVLISNCAYFRGRDYMLEADNCRASGNTLQFVPTSNDKIVARHNAITGEGGVLIGANEGDSTSTIRIENNVLVGFPRWDDATMQSSVYYANNAPAVVSWAGNLVWKVKNNTCPTGSICGQDPKLKNITLAAFDATPLDGSPVIDKVGQLADVTNDFLVQPRPSGVKSDIGAYEWQVAPPPVCSPVAPTMTVAGPTGQVAPGTTNTYTISVKNNDSAECSNTNFALARTVPAGWTGTLSAAAVTLAPGASTTATLQVTSAGTATTGSYGVGVGTSSAAGAVHTASASTVYEVLAPVCVAAAPTMTLVGPTAQVAPGTSSTYTVSVKNNDSAACASTAIGLAGTVPAGWTGTLSTPAVTLAPGASTTATLQVTSATTATTGAYGVAVSSSSAAGAVHVATASSAYNVLAPVCVAAAPTMTLTGPTTEVVPGTTNTYTISLQNNDSAACTTSAFALARTVPTGWTGLLSATSVTLAPGASTTATLQVTSSGTATAGTYGIGVGSSSAAGAVHTASASSVYSVKVIEKVVAPTMTGTVNTNKTAYLPGETVTMTARVLLDSKPLRGAAVRFGTLKPDGISEIVLRATTDTYGYAKASFVSGTGSTWIGRYRLTAQAAYGDLTSSATSTFQVGDILTNSVVTNKTTYSAGQTVSMTARVLKDGKPVSGAAVRFGALKPDGISEIVLKGTSNSQGYAKASFVSGTGLSSIGTYKLRTTATIGELSASGSTTFSVK